MNIFEELNILLSESKGEDKVKKSDIPIHPEMETKEQGEMSAAEKFLKLFQKLKMSSGSGKEDIKDSKPEVPDEVIDPMMKELPKSSKDKSFEKNKLVGWDKNDDEKIGKEVYVDDNDEEDEEEDESDDFDYKKNEFGDEDDEDEKSEDEKLKDTINDAIDSLSDDGDDSDGGDGGDDDSGANWGDDSDGDGGDDDSGSGVNRGNGDDDGDDGQQGGDSRSGKTSGGKMDGEKQSGSQNGGQQGKDNQNFSDDGKSGKSTTKYGSENETISQKQKRLNDLKKSLESDNLDDFNKKMEEVKNSTDTDTVDPVGGSIDTPSDESFKKDMKRGGFDDETIEKMTQEKNSNPNSEISEEEMDKLKKEVIDGLEKSCEKKGGSSLASTIVKNSLKRKIENEEWKEMMKLFLKGKSIGVGKMSTANKGIKWGNKNHLWRDAVLPTSAPSKGTIQTINCFVDFSGSVQEDLVFSFLGKVIDLCLELKYTDVRVYGFGQRLTLPKVLNKKSFKNGSEIALEQTWKFIEDQRPGPATENFESVAEEINEIKRKDKKAVFLIFGDGEWLNYTVGPKSLKYKIVNKKYLDDICILAYYDSPNNSLFAGVMNELREIVGIRHIITTKATSIHREKK